MGDEFSSSWVEKVPEGSDNQALTAIEGQVFGDNFSSPLADCQQRLGTASD